MQKQDFPFEIPQLQFLPIDGLEICVQSSLLSFIFCNVFLGSLLRLS